MNFKHIYNKDNKTTQYNGENVNYITTKEFEKAKNNISVGYIKPRKLDENINTDINTVTINESTFEIENKKRFLHKIDYYINIVGENNEENIFVAVTKFNIPLLLIILILFFVIIAMDYIQNPEDNIITTIYDELADEKPVTNTKPDELLKPGQVRIPGYTNIYVKNGESVYLNNPKDNTCTLKYIVKFSGSEDIIFESIDIPAGKADQWYPELELGSYSIEFYIQVTKKDGTKGITSYLPKISLEVYE